MPLCRQFTPPPTGPSNYRSVFCISDSAKANCILLNLMCVNIINRHLQFSHTVIFDSLQSHQLQHARPSCPSPTPGAYSNSCPLSRWCHPTISSSVIPFSSRLQSFPASGSFLRNQFFASGAQSIGVSASPSVLQDWSPLGWTGLILQAKGLSRVFSNSTVQKHQFFGTQLSLWSNSQIHTWPLDKTYLDSMDLC